MAESRLLDEDKDEWFYQTMDKYSNLYMFEFEFPLDTLEVINETSLCVSGLQTFSKKCELLQLCVPPKLLRSENEEGLCKDRDFKIISGGYADGKIQQMKAVGPPGPSNLIATYQDGYNGIIVYETGNDDRATILERHRLPSGDKDLPASGKSLCCFNEKIILATNAAENDLKDSTSNNGIVINEWKVGDGWVHSRPSHSYKIWNGTNDLKCGHVTKLKSWDNENTCIFLTTFGTVAIYDFRTGLNTPAVILHASKSANNQKLEQSTFSHNVPNPRIIFTFDCIPELNKIGVLDSCGGYETYDSRYISTTGTTANASSSPFKCKLPEFSDSAGVYPNWFNIEYETRTKMRENEQMTNRFIISGLKRECVPVFQEVNANVSTLIKDNKDNTIDQVKSVFSHDGHTKPVTHSIWHPVANDLVFSASVDAVLHAWQFIPEKESN